METTHTDGPMAFEQTNDPTEEGEDREIGVVLAERYLVLRRLGSGSMSTTYDVHDLAHNVRRALKVLHPFFATRPEAVERLQRQARAAALIGHPCVVEVTDLGRTADGLPYIGMEFLDGESLAERLARSGPMHLGRAGDILLQVLDALHAAHMAGIVHRALRPENVLLLRQGRDDCLVKLLDFGGAGFDDSRIVAPGWEHGGAPTPHDPSDAYAPPETAAGRGVDHRGDVYAAGVLLHEMLSGLRPYPNSVAAFIGRATDPDPARRFPSAATMGRAFAELLASQDDYVPLRPLASIGIARKQPPPATQKEATSQRRIDLAATVTSVGSADEPAWVRRPWAASRPRLARPRGPFAAGSLLERRGLVAVGIGLLVLGILLTAIVGSSADVIEEGRVPTFALAPRATPIFIAPREKARRRSYRTLRTVRRRHGHFFRGIHYGGPPEPASGVPAAPPGSPGPMPNQ